MTDQPWIWLDSQCLILYYWSWFDPGEGVAVGGWSQRGELDAWGFVHLAAEIGQSARSLKVDLTLDPTVTPHTFTGLTQLPRELTEVDGTPLSWIRTLLGESSRSTDASMRGFELPEDGRPTDAAPSAAATAQRKSRQRQRSSRNPSPGSAVGAGDSTD